MSGNGVGIVDVRKDLARPGNWQVAHLAGAADAREDVNWLELTQMQKPKHLIETAAGEDDTHAGGGTEGLDVHESELQCCCSVRVDLARH